MAKIRVLIVDDSVVVRKLLGDAVSAHADLEVVGVASNGAIALQKIPQVNPDIVVLDVEMPELGGLETLVRLRATSPRLPVLMCSSATEHGAKTTLRALELGASDYVAKPSLLAGARPDALADFKADLVAKVRALGSSHNSISAEALSRSPRLGTRIHRETVRAVGIGCSTGGPNALATLFEAIPRELEVPIFIVQHMPPLFTKLLASRLSSSSGMRVSEGQDGEFVESGRAYMAPGDYHMRVVREGVRERIALSQDAPEHSCRPAVDVLFRSMARIYGSGALCAVLTGMGQDGARGARTIHEAGGSLIVQDAESCVVASMPNAVIATGLADGAYPIAQIALEIVSRVRAGRAGLNAKADYAKGSEAGS